MGSELGRGGGGPGGQGAIFLAKRVVRICTGLALCV